MERVDLQYTPGGSYPVVHVSQMDVGKPFEVRIFDGTAPYNIPAGVTVSIDGRKPDKKVFSYTDVVSVSGNVVTVTTKRQMTILAGEVMCKLRFKQGNTDIGTLTFIMSVDPSPVNEEADTSETDIPVIIAQATEQMLTAEAYAKGTRNGVPVTEGQAGYHDNAKYWKEQTEGYVSQAQNAAGEAADSARAAAGSADSAAGSAGSAAAQALKAEGFAVGEQNGTDVPTTSPYYHNNAEFFAGKAQESADRAESYSTHTPKIGANDNWWVWDDDMGQYVDTGIDASITVDITEITMLAPSDTPRVTNEGTNTDPRFHLYIPRGTGVKSVTRINTAGLVKTYRMLFSDGYFIDYDVTDGKTAYQSAVDGGYTGTEADFESDLANFKEYRDDAVEAAGDAADSASDAADEVVLAHQEYLDAKAEADRARMYADFAEPHFLYQDNCLWVNDDAAPYFKLEDNCLWVKMIPAS